MYDSWKTRCRVISPSSQQMAVDMHAIDWAHFNRHLPDDVPPCDVFAEIGRRHLG